MRESSDAVPFTKSLLRRQNAQRNLEIEMPSKPPLRRQNAQRNIHIESPTKPPLKRLIAQSKPSN